MRSRRILITGLSTPWGGRLARALEADADVDAVIGLDTEDPRIELHRAEFVRIGTDAGLMRRIVRAAEIDTLVDTRLAFDRLSLPDQEAHEENLRGTIGILDACRGTGGAASPVRKLVVRSSAHYYGTGRDDPAFFTESMAFDQGTRGAVERGIRESEQAVAAFASSHPDVTVTVLRCADALGPGLSSPHQRLLTLPAIPSVLGFDPRLQFVDADDVVGALEFAVRNELPGTLNVAADGVLALSELAGLLGRPLVPILPPWGAGLVSRPLQLLGTGLSLELLGQLRFGRGLDNRRLKAAGYTYAFTTREAVIRLREHLRTRPLLEGAEQPYRYEREVEEFLRWSPSVRDRSDEPGDLARTETQPGLHT